MIWHHSHYSAHLRVVVSDVVVDPHPPVRVEAPGRLSQGFEELQKPLGGLRGFPVVHVPGQQDQYIDEIRACQFSLSGESSPGRVVAVAS